MKVSARNVFRGTIRRLVQSAVNTEVELLTTEGDTLVAIVTAGSVKTLGLAVGGQVAALVKAPWVLLSTTSNTQVFSARNQLPGTVTALNKGTVNCEVTLRLAGGTQVHAVITNQSATALGLAPGVAATAIIKASDVILAVPA